MRSKRSVADAWIPWWRVLAVVVVLIFDVPPRRTTRTQQGDHEPGPRAQPRQDVLPRVAADLPAVGRGHTGDGSPVAVRRRVAGQRLPLAAQRAGRAPRCGPRRPPRRAQHREGLRRALAACVTSSSRRPRWRRPRPSGTPAVRRCARSWRSSRSARSTGTCPTPATGSPEAALRCTTSSPAGVRPGVRV